MEWVNTLMSVLEMTGTILVTVLILVRLAKAFIQGSSKEEVMRLLTVLVKEAEEDFGPSMGSAKFLQAVSRFYNALPNTIQLAYSLKDVQGLIEQILKTEKIGTPH